MSVFRIAVYLFFCLTVSSSIQAQTVQSDRYYRLSTQFRGGDMLLDVFNGGPKNNMTHLTRRQNVSGQFWRFHPAGNGYYRLTTEFRGNTMCLDVINGGARNNQVHLTECGNYSGQFWKVRRDGDWARLTTQFRGPNVCLDIFNGGANDNQPHLTDCANFSGQYWKLSKSNRSVSNGGRSDLKSAAGSKPFKCGKNYKLKNGECVMLQNCGRNAYRNVEGDCHCKKGYRWRGGKCKWVAKKKKRKKKKRKLKQGSCAWWKDQWKRSGSQGAYKKMVDACDKRTGSPKQKSAPASSNQCAQWWDQWRQSGIQSALQKFQTRCK